MKKPTLTMRLLSFTDRPKGDGCWEWCGAVLKGYGAFTVRRGRQIAAHRAVYLVTKGHIPAGMVLDHLCRNTRCVNPGHLEPVTNALNIKRGYSPKRAQTHCWRGHPFDAENTLMSGGTRHCKACISFRAKIRRAA